MSKIALIEPFYTGSHKVWADQLIQYSSHGIKLFSLPGKHWKWRMHGGAIELAEQLLSADFQPDFILATDMLDVSLFTSLIRKEYSDTPVAMYFHESQFHYPVSPNDSDKKSGRDNHYSFMNYSGALCADKLFFNSKYHRESYLKGVKGMLSKLPDFKGLENVEKLDGKSEVLYLGLELPSITKKEKTTNKLRVLWNHRWEHDKNPVAFLRVMQKLAKERNDVELVLLGQPAQLTEELEVALNSLSTYIIHSGFVEDHTQYLELLASCHVLPVTSNHDYFGISVVEAINYGVYPLLPRRLSYTELIPEDLHIECLYSNENELLQRLVNFEKKDSATVELINHVGQFKWPKMIAEYDSKFSELIH